jgi:hypothetical protein
MRAFIRVQLNVAVPHRVRPLSVMGLIGRLYYQPGKVTKKMQLQQQEDELRALKQQFGL